jgi:tetratricopeptide (TPR) repeat protein
MRKGLEAFSYAIDLDPTYPLAHVGQADSFNVLGYYGVLPPTEAFPKAKAAAERALQLDPALGEPHTSLGYAAFFYDWDWAAAESHHRRSIDVTPRYSLGRHWYATMLAGVGRFPEALREIDIARDLDPLSLSVNSAVGLVKMLAREFSAAIEQFRRVLDLDGTYALAHAWLAQACTHAGQKHEAVAASERLAALVPNSRSLIAITGYCQARCGLATAAEQILAQLDAKSSERYVSPLHTAVVRIGLGDSDGAINDLRESVRERSFNLFWPKTNALFDPIRDDPRFGELLKSAGLV